MRNVKCRIKYLFIIIVFFYGQLNGQNSAWFPLRPGTNHNYSIDTSAAPIAAVVRIDSLAGGKYYLNTVVAKCGNCIHSQLTNDPYDSTYTLANQPQFLQYAWVKTMAGGFYFTGSKKFVIYPFLGTGSTWLYDTLNYTQATMLSKISQTVLGIPDSVCFIKLSTNDTIQLSKNNGIIQFPYKTLGSHRYKLVGLEGAINAGLKIKRFHDFFDFSPGDVFQFEFRDSDYNILPPMFKQGSDRWDILSSAIYVDSVCYLVRQTYCDSVKYGNNQPSITAFTQTVNMTFTDSSRHPANLLPLEKISVNSYFIYNNGIPYIHKITFGFENFRDTKSFGQNCPNIYLSNGMSGAGEQTQFKDIYLNKNSSKLVGRKLTTGLGFTSELYNDYDRIYQRCMTGYIKGNDTSGTILSMLPNEDRYDFLIYPNPANKKFTVKVKSNKGAQLTVLNALGQPVQSFIIDDPAMEKEIDISQITNGIYFIMLVEPAGMLMKKLVIQN